ncbi:MAG: DndE family protein, partial [Chlorobium sp.]|nr:DndE family protein [Chlorobium sp.]
MLRRVQINCGKGRVLLELNGLEFKRIKLSQESTKKLQLFKSRTGLTPNIACRLALG